MSIKDVSKRASSESPTNNPTLRTVEEGTVLHPRVRIAIDFMKANLHLRVRLAELGQITNLSSSRLSHLFKIQTGFSPGMYLRRLKMEEARHLLVTSLMSVKEIMARVGYKSKSHFVRDFRRAFHVAPSKYRKSVSRPRSDKRS